MRIEHILIPAVLAAACTTGGAPNGAAAPAPAPSSRAAFRHEIDSMVGQREFRDAHFGVLIVNPTNGDTLYSRNAGKLFMPASNMKIVTSATALAQLGPDYRYRTDFAARGPIVHDTLQGALVVTGAAIRRSATTCAARDEAAARHRRLVARARRRRDHRRRDRRADVFPDYDDRLRLVVGGLLGRLRRRRRRALSTRDSRRRTRTAARVGSRTAS